MKHEEIPPDVQAAANAMMDEAVLYGPGVLHPDESIIILKFAALRQSQHGGRLAEHAVECVKQLQKPSTPVGLFRNS